MITWTKYRTKLLPCAPRKTTFLIFAKAGHPTFFKNAFHRNVITTNFLNASRVKQNWIILTSSYNNNEVFFPQCVQKTLHTGKECVNFLHIHLADGCLLCTQKLLLLLPTSPGTLLKKLLTSLQVKKNIADRYKSFWSRKQVF